MAYRIEKTDVGADIVIDGFEKGIAASPYDGISDMRNMNIISVPNEASVGYQTSAAQQTPLSAVAWTVTASTDTFAYTGTVLKAGTAVVLTVSAGAAGITNGNTYWVRDVTSTTFKVGSGVDASGTVSAAIDVTTDGSGTMTTVNLGLLNQIVSSQSVVIAGTTSLVNATMYGVDTNGRAWVFIPATPNWVYLGNSTINASPPRPNGIAVFYNYILVFRAGDNRIDYRLINGTSSLSAWTYGWKTTGVSSTSARTFFDSNGTLYWGNGSAVSYLLQLTTFDPTDSTTYTFTASGLLIPSFDAVSCISQLGTNLLIGGALNVVYQWDRFSTGYTPIFLPEAGTQRIVVVNSNAYLFSGDRGRIYVTNGANVQLYQKVPDHLADTPEPYFQWGGAVYSRNQIYFSLIAINSKTGALIPNYGGIWAVSTDTNAIRLVNKMSYGTYGGYVSELAQVSTAASAINVGFPQVSLISGWYDGISLNGSDYVSTTPTPYSNYEAYVDGDMIPVGTYLNPNTDANVEFKLTVPMVAGEGVKLAYRQDLSQSFTDITNGEFTTAGTFSGVAKVNFQKSQWLQIRTYTKSTSSSPSFTRLREIRLR